MDVTKLMLSRLFDTTERLEAPLFQRPYVWNRERNGVPCNRLADSGPPQEELVSGNKSGVIRVVV